ncbi:MAG: formylglycine-generating enzyme family protein [Bdellovibrionales bacterium]|nr:formylglycine-generating enzyme family protein [Bdellovibrionales bacterium]
MKSMKYWRGSILGVLLLTTSSAFAATSHCKNPTEITLDGDVKMKFCEIPAANGVLIGSENGEADEKPVKARDFKSFQMGQFTVTQQQYKAVMGEEPWKENGTVKSYVQEGDNNPAVYVSYIQAKQFARVMNLIDPSARYRLPTEAEFEYSARAGTMTNYYWGDEIDPSYVYYWENSRGVAEYARNVTTCPVAALDRKYPGYCANDFGLMHMLGNVWQWTADAYVNSYTNAPTDGNVAVAGDAGSLRVMRGGSWNDGAQYVRSANRGSVAPDLRDGIVGFRLVRTPR